MASKTTAVALFLCSITTNVLFQATIASAACMDSSSPVQLGSLSVACSEGNSGNPGTAWLCKNQYFQKQCPKACDVCDDLNLDENPNDGCADYSDTTESIKIGKNEYVCSDYVDAQKKPLGPKPNAGTAWLCNNKKFKKVCPVTCQACGGDEPKPPGTDCANQIDSTESIKLGKDLYECSDSATIPWLCDKNKFKKACPVTCDVCGDTPKPPGDDKPKPPGDDKPKPPGDDKPTPPENDCSDTEQNIKIGKDLYQCSDNVSTPWLCTNKKFKKGCPVTCEVCEGETPSDNSCNDTSGRFMVGALETQCSEGAAGVQGGAWLCKVNFFKKKCPVTCGGC